MERKLPFTFFLTAFIMAVLVVFYVFSLRSQLQEVLANQANYEETVKALSSVEGSEALEQNRLFLEEFFTYESTEERYENIKPLMTDKGYAATHPSGSEQPKSNISVSSSASGLKAFEYRESKSESEFINEFTLATEFNDVTSTETVLVKTKLVYVKDQGWKVDDVEYVGDLTGG